MDCSECEKSLIPCPICEGEMHTHEDYDIGDGEEIEVSHCPSCKVFYPVSAIASEDFDRDLIKEAFRTVVAGMRDPLAAVGLRPPADSTLVPLEVYTAVGFRTATGEWPGNFHPENAILDTLRVVHNLQRMIRDIRDEYQTEREGHELAVRVRNEIVDLLAEIDRATASGDAELVSAATDLRLQTLRLLLQGEPS